MAKDLTSISKVTTGSTREKHLLSASYLGDEHLAVVRQTAAWNSKQLVATPLSARFIFAWANGYEDYPNVQGGAAVYGDTDTLISDVSSDLANASSWGITDRALFSYFCRRNNPAAIAGGLPDSYKYSGHGRDILALRFSLRGLPLARATSFSAYIRAYMPSLLLCPADWMWGNATIPGSNEPPANNASLFDVWLADSPTKAADANTPTQAFDLWGNCNNGLAPRSEMSLDDLEQATGRNLQAATYDPFYVSATSYKGDADDQSTRVFQELDANNDVIPYYHDFELTGDCKNFLANHMGAFWMMVAFRAGNAFARNVVGSHYGLAPGASMMLYIQRFELVLNVTSTIFN